MPLGLSAMGYALIRRLVIVLSLLAFVGTGLAETTTVAWTEPPGNAMVSGASEAPMPCCPAKALSCVTDAGCVFLVGLPMPQSLVSVNFAWSLLAYRISHDDGEGLSIQPALGPPILLT